MVHRPNPRVRIMMMSGQVHPLRNRHPVQHEGGGKWVGGNHFGFTLTWLASLTRYLSTYLVSASLMRARAVATTADGRPPKVKFVR